MKEEDCYYIEDDCSYVCMFCAYCMDQEEVEGHVCDSGWVAVGDKKPDEFLGYLVSTECYSDAAIIAYWSRDRKWMDGRKDITDSVTHWMHLPITPVAEEMNSPMSGQPKT